LLGDSLVSAVARRVVVGLASENIAGCVNGGR
jgi:hypothetical protein